MTTSNPLKETVNLLRTSGTEPQMGQLANTLDAVLEMMAMNAKVVFRLLTEVDSSLPVVVAPTTYVSDYFADGDDTPAYVCGEDYLVFDGGELSSNLKGMIPSIIMEETTERLMEAIPEPYRTEAKAGGVYVEVETSRIPGVVIQHPGPFASTAVSMLSSIGHAFHTNPDWPSFYEALTLRLEATFPENMVEVDPNLSPENLFICCVATPASEEERAVDPNHAGNLYCRIGNIDPN